MLGMRVVESVYATRPHTFHVVRSWRARLLSWPWRPWQRCTQVTAQVPAAYMTPDALIAHPDVVRELRQLEQRLRREDGEC